ncbi:hypothetical protein OIU84_010130 [Salix udensis]|uniref:Uncharacterized protein n=1 Tax=Salix udensis TaxID=889485 RepID=A0AAD6NVE4_9ROSI|nr:hypothetical protein OIU84_010130 [Salix udensis]
MAKMSTSAIVLTKIDLVKKLCFLGKSAELAGSTTLFVVAMDHLIRQDRLKSHGEECLKRMDQHLASIEPIMEPANGKDQAVKWTVRLLENILHCSCRTPWIEQWRRVDGCSFPILEKIKDSKLLFSRKYCVGRGGAVNLLVKVNKAFNDAVF